MINQGRLNKLELKLHKLINPINPDLPTKEELRDFLVFSKYFYKLLTDREFVISQPISRQSHQLILSDLVPQIIGGELVRVMINIPPRYGKTIWAILLISYGIAFYPDSQYLYISYSADVAVKQTATIRSIIALPQFYEIFGISLDPESKAKNDFMTTKGGRVLGVGAGGPITSNGAGIKYATRFGGLAILDDMHKPSEVTSDPVRNEVKDWFQTTFFSRVNQPDKTPVIYIGQITHEDDVAMNLRQGKLDTKKWELIILRGLDEAGNALDPAMHTAEDHKLMEKTMPYMWWAQYQQEPQPAGGSVFPARDFLILNECPDNIVETYITIDTAETSKNYSDFTVFSFWGMYKIKIGNIETDRWGLHWLGCRQMKIEPKELQDAFFQFYYECCQFKIHPIVIGIEKKSTGATLLSVLSEVKGIRVINTIDHRIEVKKIEEMKEDIIRKSNKIDRFIYAQSFVCSNRITFDRSMDHARMCIDHCAKITANDSHVHDDIADTMADAILMLPFMEKQIRKAPGGTVHIPNYKAIPDYRNTQKRQGWR